jgi:hypothetical protein
VVHPTTGYPKERSKGGTFHLRSLVSCYAAMFMEDENDVRMKKPLEQEPEHLRTKQVAVNDPDIFLQDNGAKLTQRRDRHSPFRGVEANRRMRDLDLSIERAKRIQVNGTYALLTLEVGSQD